MRGAGETVTIAGFGAVSKIYSRDNGGEVAIVEHPFAVGTITAPHRHTREDEHSIVLEAAGHAAACYFPDAGMRSSVRSFTLLKRPLQ
jgi:hypothetical protein